MSVAFEPNNRHVHSYESLPRQTSIHSESLAGRVEAAAVGFCDRHTKIAIPLLIGLGGGVLCGTCGALAGFMEGGLSRAVTKGVEGGVMGFVGCAGLVSTLFSVAAFSVWVVKK